MRRKTVRDRKEVAFRLEDVLCPDLDVIIAHLGSGVEVVGKVNFFSDSGSGKKEFAIVEVPGIAVPLVVPRERLRKLTVREYDRESKKLLNDAMNCMVP